LSLKKISTAIYLAIRSVYSVKAKTWMAMTTILVGSLAVSAAFTLNENMKRYVENLLEENGGPKITVSVFGEESLTDKESDLFSRLSVVSETYLTDSSYGSSLRISDRTASVELLAVTDDYIKKVPIKVKKGRFLHSLDLHSSSAFIAVSPDVKERLKYKLINKYVFFDSKHKHNIPAKIVGIVTNRSQMYDDGRVWVPYKFYKGLTGKNKLQKLEIVAKDVKWMNWIENFANSSLQKRGFYSLWVQNPFQKFSDIQKEMQAFIYIGYALGAVALLAGSIGTMNVLLLNMNLRFREIGLYKAIGFSTPMILLQLSFESFLISGLGGIVGSFLGSFAGAWMSKIMLPIGLFSFKGFVLGALSSILFGLILGLIPSTKAAHLDPVKALQG
jgi:ABC-type antimicrobial peptide transport system permease subunit